MKKTLAAVTFCIVALFLPSASFAQAPKIQIFVKHYGNDGVGSRFVYALKEEINKSSRYELAASDEPATVPKFRIEIISQDISAGDKGAASAVSFVNELIVSDQPAWKWDHNLMVMGSRRVQESAQDFIAAMDKRWDEVVASSIKAYGLPKK